MYRQLISFDPKKAGNAKGYCLADTRKGFGIAPKYPDAWTAWLHTEQHTDPIPTGVDVPVYFSYLDDHNGHIAICMSNGKFWSEGTTYNSMQDYLKNHTPKYVGWGESINGVKVLEHAPDIIMAAKITEQPPESLVGKTLYLHANVKKWAFYKPGTPLPLQRKNRAGELSPAKWNGLAYRIDKVVAPNTVQVHSPSLGDILLWVDSDATIR